MTAGPGLHGGPDAIRNPDRRFLAIALRGNLRLEENVSRAEFQCLECGLGPLTSERRNHDDRQRPLRHDLFQKRQAIHPRHVKVEQEHVRQSVADLLRRFEGVLRCSAKLEPRVLPDEGRQKCPHRRAVVHDHDIDLVFHDCPLTFPIDRWPEHVEIRVSHAHGFGMTKV